MHKKDFFILFFISFLQITVTLTFSNNNPYEPTYRVDKNNVIFEKYGREIGLTENISSHREFLNGASDDTIQYFILAIDEIDNSRVPFSYRFFYPKIIGTISKIVTSKSDEIYSYKDSLFKKVSFLSRFSNLFSCIFLLLIPFLFFRNIFFRKETSGIASLILTMNLINAGNIMAVPFFNVDLLNMVFFSLAAGFFYKKKILFYLITISFGLLIKEVAIILVIPLLFLILKNDSLNLFKKFIAVFIPFIIFFSIRAYVSSNPFGLNIGSNGSIVSFNSILQNGISSFYYLNEHTSPKMFFLFIVRLFLSVGFIYIIACYLRIRLKINKNFFIVSNLVFFFIILAVFLHASGVQRTIQISSPFLIFYSLSVLDKFINFNKIKIQ